ncbi:MAG: YitT family protein [Clostridia bacterium]|nr:YitT family protein [Clostridia bacterium]
MNKSTRREIVSAYVLIVLGCVIGGAAYPAFLTPSSIAPGGLTGLATILNYVFHFPVGITSMVMNLPLFVVSFIFMGGRFVFRSFVATILFSLCIDFLPIPAMTDDILLNSVFGGVVLGIGLGLIQKGFATTGGTDMIALMIHKRISFVSVGAVLFFIDFAVIVAAGFTMTPVIALYSMICIFVSSKALDLVMAGFGNAKACYIITDKHKQISDRVLTEMERGVTRLEVIGEYSGEKRNMLLCVVSSRETAPLKRIVKAEDASAFMFVTDTHETLGEGFASLNE